MQFFAKTIDAPPTLSAPEIIAEENNLAAGVVPMGEWTYSRETIPDSGLAININGHTIPAHSDLDILVTSDDLFINGLSVRETDRISLPSGLFPESHFEPDSAHVSVSSVATNACSSYQQGFEMIIRALEHNLPIGGTLLIGLTANHQIYCALLPPKSAPTYSEDSSIISGVLKTANKLNALFEP
jgi:hypothetical protein